MLPSGWVPSYLVTVDLHRKAELSARRSLLYTWRMGGLRKKTKGSPFFRRVTRSHPPSRQKSNQRTVATVRRGPCICTEYASSYVSYFYVTFGALFFPSSLRVLASLDPFLHLWPSYPEITHQPNRSGTIPRLSVG